MKSEERRVKNPCAKVMLASIINKTNVPADLEIVVQTRAETNCIWLCREQPAINRINLPELNIRIFDPLKIPIIYVKQVQKRNQA